MIRPGSGCRTEAMRKAALTLVASVGLTVGVFTAPANAALPSPTSGLLSAPATVLSGPIGAAVAVAASDAAKPLDTASSRGGSAA